MIPQLADPPADIIALGASVDTRSDSRDETGAHAGAGRVYRPSPAMADRIRERDRVCRFPGCRQPATRCDLDHRTPYHQGAPTTEANLDCLCRYHHRVKTFTPWHATRLPGNRLQWTSPLGVTITDEPENPYLTAESTLSVTRGGTTPLSGEPPF